jgi:hypothetical protein
MIRTVLALLFSLAGVARAADQTELRIEGHITAAVAAKIHEALAQGSRVIRITSTGGDPLASLALARDIRLAHASLIVDGICGGPCANYLFPAAAKRSVLPGGLVIFSNTATAALAMVPPDKAKMVGSNYTRTAAEEAIFFKEASLNPALLLEPMLRLHPTCYSLTSKDTAGKSYINYRADFIGWVPSRAYLARVGVRSEGFWPATPSQFQAALGQVFPGGARGAIANSGPSRPGKAQSLLAALEAVRACDASGH